MNTSLIIPAYNEELRLQPFLLSIQHYLQRHPQALQEIIIVDDGSHDATTSIARKFHRQIPPLKLISHPTNLGKGAAIQTGVLAAKGDYLVFMDADGATDISELPKLVNALSTADLAVGNRWIPGASAQRHSALRTLAGWLYRQYMRFFGLQDIDTMCGFKGFKRPVALALFRHLQEKRWLFDTEIMYKAKRANYRIKNLPIRWESKDGSKLNFSTQLKAALAIWPLIRKL
jgi:dolichyl-phosphate beta-glucosyltransferase